MTHANYLELFNHVLTHGTKQLSTMCLGSLSAWHEIDGYTCYLRSEGVTLTLLFHNRFSYEYDDESALLTFKSETEKVFASIKKSMI
ncbi:DUF3081 family protein [Shewanella sp. VB17]|uniref:DUF3081 family protein n=1 Tax=Shewanella sp. VB17 TaxID=2739432 RepID=UPI001565FEAC|nr:DUF3081 family protein [Shewanella sp. VB17]NRD72666.1 DUF3081 family protein [Shewanella sp. VB17]